MDDGAPMIALQSVSKDYGTGAKAVDDVSLLVPKGQFVALVGASGSGKTTLLKIINRLVVADTGDVSVAGESVATKSPTLLRRGIGYVFQGVGLFPHLSVAENIGIVPSLLGWPAATIATRTAALLELVDLPQSYATRLPNALSGGQRQRVGVARALAAGPKIMLMDEPFGALDPVTRDALGGLYRKMHDDLGLTTVMVTHDVQEAVLLADRIVVMDQGRILADGAPAVLLRGHPDPIVEALMSTPRIMAERVRRLIERSAANTPAPPNGID